MTRELFDETERRDPGHRRRWVVLVVGDRHQIDRIRSEAKRRRIEPVFVLDLIHELEYLWKAAWCFFEQGDAAAEAWVTEHALAILEGSSSYVAAGIRRSATRRGLRTQDRKGADDCADSLLAKRDMLHYDTYLEVGLPIATGGHRGGLPAPHQGPPRFHRRRWSVRGAEAVLRLPAVRSSGDFEAYWRCHLQHEYQRYHVSSYAAAA